MIKPNEFTGTHKGNFFRMLDDVEAAREALSNINSTYLAR